MLTVVMASYNGGETLPRVLEGFTELHSPIGGWKLLVVDNGSTDQTRDIIESFKARLPLTYLFDPVRGKSHALNAALASVSGDLAIFTDDDVLPHADWLVQMRNAADTLAEFSIFGGAIVPHWDQPAEPWILKWQYIVSITDPAWEEGPIAATRVYGPNMGIRSSIVDAGFRFDTFSGPAGGRYQMGEDTDFMQRLSQAGFRAWYCKRAVVAHIIRKRQMTKEWILRRAYPFGRAEYRREFRDEPNSPALLAGTPRHIVRDVLSQAVRFARINLSRNRDLSFDERWRLHYLVGRMMEGRKIHHRRGA